MLRCCELSRTPSRAGHDTVSQAIARVLFCVPQLGVPKLPNIPGKVIKIFKLAEVWSTGKVCNASSTRDVGSGLIVPTSRRTEVRIWGLGFGVPIFVSF